MKDNMLIPFIIGIIFGIIISLGFYQYYIFINKQEKMSERMENILAKTEALELLKNSSERSEARA